MLKNALLSLAGLLVLLGLATCFLITRGPRDLRDKRLNVRVPVDLEGVATVALPPTFRLAGVVNSGERGWLGGDLTTLEYHLDEKLLSFRFEQGQHNTLGGYRADPVILDVTLFNHAVPAEEISRVTSTTIDRFYSPTGQTSFAAVPWMPDVRDGAGVTKSAEVADGMGASNPRRWLIVHADPARRVRVDFFAWKKSYELAVAQTLIREIARSVSPTPALQTHFEEIKTFDQRMVAKRDRLIDEIGRKMAACALPSPVTGQVVFGQRCLMAVSADRRYVWVGRYLGAAPASAATRARGEAPRLPLATRYEVRGTKKVIDGLPNLDVVTFYWAEEDGGWKFGGLQGHPSERSVEGNPAIPAVAARLTTRADVHLFRFRSYDVMFRPDLVDVEDFLLDSDWYQAGLTEGKILPGIRVKTGAFPE